MLTVLFVPSCAFPHTVIVMSRDIEQGREGGSSVFSFSLLFLFSFEVLIEEDSEIAQPGGAAAQLRHNERPEIGAHLVPVEDI